MFPKEDTFPDSDIKRETSCSHSNDSNPPKLGHEFKFGFTIDNHQEPKENKESDNADKFAKQTSQFFL